MGRIKNGSSRGKILIVGNVHDTTNLVKININSNGRVRAHDTTRLVVGNINSNTW